LGIGIFSENTFIKLKNRLVEFYEIKKCGNQFKAYNAAVSHL